MSGCLPEDYRGRVFEIHVDVFVLLVEGGRDIVWRGWDERAKWAAEVIIAVSATVKHKSIFVEVISGVFALEHRHSEFLYVSEGWRGILEGRRWRGRVLEIRRRFMMTMGVG